MHAYLRFLTLTAAATVCGCDLFVPGAATPPAETAAIELPSIEGKLATVTTRPWPQIAKVQGSFFADEMTTIAAKVPGRVLEINCDLGDQVNRDDVLIKIDPREYELLVSQAESQLAQARSAIGMKPGDLIENLNPMNAPPVREAKAVLEEAKQNVQRLQSLFEQKAVVAIDLEAALAVESVADARYNSALNSVREKMALVGVQTANRALAEQRLIDTTIRAPFKGMIQSRMVSIGTYVNVGQPMLELVGTDTLRYRASVPERFVGDLRIGQRVLLLLQGDERVEVRVTRISPALDPNSRSLLFEAEVPNPNGRLRSGTFAQADIILKEDSKSLTIPSSALVRFAGVQKVWTVSHGKVTDVVVEIGREQKNTVEILSGLSEGQVILLDGRLGGVGIYKGDALAQSNTDLEASETTSKLVGDVARSPGDQDADEKETATQPLVPQASNGLGQ